MRLRSYLYGLATAVAVTGAVAVAQGMRPTDDTVLADVNGQKITYRQLLGHLLDYHAENTLDALINRQVVDQAAAREKITVSEADIDRRVQEVKTVLGGAGGDSARAARNYRDWLEQSGLTERQHRDQVRYTILQELLAMKASPIIDADLERLQVRVIACNNKQKAMEIIRSLGARRDFGE